MVAPALLPVLTLPYPLVLLPTARTQVALDEATGSRLIELVQRSDAPQLTVGTVPISTSNSLHSWGTLARVVRVVRPVSRGPQRFYNVTLQGLSRIHFPDLDPTPIGVGPNELLELAVYIPTQDGCPSHEAIGPFRSAASKLLDYIAQDANQQSRRDVYLKISHMIEEVSDDRTPWMADVIVAGINKVEYDDKLAYLAAAGPDQRLRRATELFIKQASISEVTKKIAQSVDESLSKQQKEFFLRQQLAAIQRELNSLNRSSQNSEAPGARTPKTPSELDDNEQSEADDMAEIKSKIEAMAKDSDERKMAVREWKRLQRIPSGSVEHGVIRNYLEWITSIPWPSSAAFAASTSADKLRDRSFLTSARKQLDDDHYGLEKIKKRLIEYLAVVRLKQLQAEREELAASSAMSSAASSNEGAQRSEGDSNWLAIKRIKQALNGYATGVTEKQSVKTSPPLAPRASGASQSRGAATKAVKGPILLFVGPPGTGKTSLGQSIARALDRPFQRISLGGVRDEAEIRGHRRTYVASGPGSIVQALRKAGRPDPVILLDEIDKVGHSNFHGDPSAALLEVLDPEQNHSFNDHYINVPIDLSQVLFICTSNSLETMASPLLDRCEIVHLSGYTYDEKIHIARKFLLPKQLKANGLTPEHVTLTDSALLHIATHYTREAGVRSLERAISAVVRYKAVEWAEFSDVTGITDVSQVPAPEAQEKLGRVYRKLVEEHELEKILGIARWDEEEMHREERRGLIYGLVVTGMGEGGILPIETTAVPGTGQLKLTGSLGEVIKESGELALSWVKSHAFDLYITKLRSQDPLKVPDPIDIHLHLPSGAVKKDGPSAGIAMTCAFVSLLTGATVPASVAMTGEVTLRGRVGPVGGIKEKVLGAHRAGVAKLILPWANRKDVEHDVPLEVRAEVQIVFVRSMEDVLEAAFGKGVLSWRRDVVVAGLESRL
ncbi:ATP-dependent protease La [Epithele typhae]|uniref:ATP-dependent protease La n=1 Tax=Epithele typhae TaxID=378194 RepID=UPI0020075D98|nr:ATP-dependent protease La [Epithele typhae]KAH9922330.1 ATP-dependent protease La [Epithele typhae]